MIYTENLRTALATDTYIVGNLTAFDEDYIVYEPQFTYHGFRSVGLLPSLSLLVVTANVPG